MSYLLGDYLIEAFGITNKDGELILQADIPPDCAVIFIRQSVWEKMKQTLLSGAN